MGICKSKDQGKGKHGKGDSRRPTDTQNPFKGQRVGKNQHATSSMRSNDKREHLTKNMSGGNVVHHEKGSGVPTDTEEAHEKMGVPQNGEVKVHLDF